MTKRRTKPTNGHLATYGAGFNERGCESSQLLQKLSKRDQIMIIDDVAKMKESFLTIFTILTSIGENPRIDAFLKQSSSGPQSLESRSARFRGHVRDYSLQSRHWRRLSVKLLPLLLREQDFESSIHLMEIMKTSSSLSDLLDKNAQLLENLDFEVAEALLELLDMLESFLSRLALIFQRKYESLNNAKSAAELIFEFPNNIRHICTTMPWTILPALIVLWGVCWMFIIGSQAVDHETLTPTFSPTPAANELFDTSWLSNLQGADPSTMLFDFPIGDQDPFDSLFPDEPADHTMNPLDWANGSPQDPNFLTAGVIPDDQVDLNGLGIIHGSVAKAQSNGVLRVNGLPDSESSDRLSNGQKSKQRVECPTCQRSFAALFTLKRHQAYKHRGPVITQQTLFLCPNVGCKRSKDKYPFPRKDGLTRQLLNCKYKQNASSSEGTPNASQSAPLSCSDIPGSLVHLEDHEQDGFGHHMSQEKPRLENKDDGPENEQLLADMKKKLLRLTDEIEKKERELAADKNARDSLEKAVLALEGS